MSTPAGNDRITILLVDDSEVVRVGLGALLTTDPALKIVGEAGTVAAGVAHCVRLRPHIVLLDIRLPDGSGIDACREMLKLAPETRILMLTSVVENAVVEEALRAGAHGYLLKEIDGRGLISAIREVAGGGSVLDPAVTARVMQSVKSGGNGRQARSSLSPQERRVLALVADGCTNKEIGLKLGLSEKTVKNYLSTLFEKLHVSRRAEAAVIYAQELQGQR